jgi:hypothetical protein
MNVETEEGRSEGYHEDQHRDEKNAHRESPPCAPRPRRAKNFAHIWAHVQLTERPLSRKHRTFLRQSLNAGYPPKAGLKDRPSERSGSARKRVFQEQPGYFPMLQVMRSLVLDAIAGFVTT